MPDFNEVSRKIDPIMKDLSSRYKIKKLGIFGSTARGQAEPDSDVDILVEFFEIPGLFDFMRLEEELESVLKVRVDLVREKAVRPEIRQSIFKDLRYL